MEPDIDKIEAYLSGTLTGTERQAFEAKLTQSPELAEEVDVVRLAQEAVELSIEDNLRAQFQEWQSAEMKKNQTAEAKVVKMAPRNTIRRILAIAASVLLLLTAGSFWYANNQFSTEKLAMGYYDDIPMDLYVRGNSNPMADAVAAMTNENYEEADAYFQQLTIADDQYFNARYYLAHSLHRQGNYVESNNILNALNETENLNIREDGQWLKVLNFLELGQTENTEFQILLSEMIEDDGHTHHSDAKSLNNKLNSFWYKLAN